ncbi:MAG TPA: peptide deformylase [Methylomirabilota bacterium]|jgi:peptide deformylase|nr:peptide deformylase [Methylomirabilota bacterium]
MAVLSVRHYGDPGLRRRAEPVTAVTPEIESLLGDMGETMYDQVGIGLAAPQIGIALRIFVLDAGKGVTRAYFNPVIVEAGGTVREDEGCLSLPGIFADVTRSEWVVIEAQDRQGAPIRQRATGLLARVFQHEIDHLDGILFIDRLDKVTRDRIKRRIKKEGFREELAGGARPL